MTAPTPPSPKPAPTPPPAPTPVRGPGDPNGADLLAHLTGALGFKANAQAKAERQARADEAGMNRGGAYVVTDIVTSDKGVSVMLERNVGTDEVGGLQAQISYPAVAIIEGPKGRVAFNPSDVALAERLATELA